MIKLIIFLIKGFATLLCFLLWWINLFIIIIMWDINLMVTNEIVDLIWDKSKNKKI